MGKINWNKTVSRDPEKYWTSSASATFARRILFKTSLSASNRWSKIAKALLAPGQHPGARRADIGADRQGGQGPLSHYSAKLKADGVCMCYILPHRWRRSSRSRIGSRFLRDESDDRRKSRRYSEITLDQIIARMVGRDIKDNVPQGRFHAGRSHAGGQKSDCDQSGDSRHFTR